MDLTQRKLTRAEWNNIEIPVSSSEKQIITMICEGYHNINIVHNYTKALLTYLKISATPPIEQYVFEKYIAPELLPVIKEFKLDPITTDKKYKKHTIKKADVKDIALAVVGATFGVSHCLSRWYVVGTKSAVRSA